jgi:hypothetical protein
VQAIAAWLVARPERAVFVLIVTFPLPFTSIIGSSVLVLLVLSSGLARTLQVTGIAYAAIFLMSLLTSMPLAFLNQVALTIWMPAVLLATLLQRTRSLTLSLQVSALAALLVLVALHVVAGDLTAYWQEVQKEFVGLLGGGDQQTEAELSAQLLPLLPNMTGYAVAFGWLIYVAAFLAGYKAYVGLPGKSDDFGSITGLNFGRVLALILALTSIVAVLADSKWLQNIALVLFAIFWLQGLTILHWLRAIGKLPGFALAAVYVFTVLSGQLLFSIVGLIGYTDAWFDYRARIAGK